uniref:F-box domain-containing protein n=1 Tax=Schizophyllum commune (strain H4-8 / FGSC 9210) TaxID=578458 RepID=D8QB87_SCHCM
MALTDKYLMGTEGRVNLIGYPRQQGLPLTTIDYRRPLHIGARRLWKDLPRVCDALDVCNREIDELESALNKLRHRRDQLESTKFGINSLLSPLRKVPPEILAEIAAYTLPAQWFNDQIGKHVWRFTQICRTWREVAIGMHWPWAHFSVSKSAFDQPSPAMISAVTTYLERSGSLPLTVMGIHTRWDEGTQDALWTHIGRIQTYEAMCAYDEDDGGLDGRCFPALRKLLIRNGSCCSVEAPNLRVAELFETHAESIYLPWENLRALQIYGDLTMYPSSVQVLHKCPNLEVFSLLDVLDCQLHPSSSTLIPLHCLHTLEVGLRFIDALPFLFAPNIRHFILDMAFDPDERPGNVFPVACSKLLEPVTCITLRNLESYMESLLTSVVSMPKRLRKLCLVEDTRVWDSTRPIAVLHEDLVSTLCKPSAYPFLTEIEVANGEKAVEWTSTDVALVQRLLETRAAPPPDMVAPLERLSLWAPYATELPPELLAGKFTNLRTRSGAPILHLNVDSPRVPVEPFEIASALS